MNSTFTLNSNNKKITTDPLEMYRQMLERCAQLKTGTENFSDVWEKIWKPFIDYSNSNQYSYKGNAGAIGKVIKNFNELIESKNFDFADYMIEDFWKIYHRLDISHTLMLACYHLLESPNRRSNPIEQVKEIRTGIFMISVRSDDIYRYIVSTKDKSTVLDAIANIETLCTELINFKWQANYFIKDKKKRREAIHIFNESICFAKSLLWDFSRLRKEIPITDDAISSSEESLLESDKLNSCISILKDRCSNTKDSHEKPVDIASLDEAIDAFFDTYEEWSNVYNSLATK